MITQDSDPLLPDSSTHPHVIQPLGLTFDQIASLVVLWTLPEMLYAVLYWYNPSYTDVLFSHHIGKRMSMFALGSTLVGAVAHAFSYRKLNRQWNLGTRHRRKSSFFIDTVVIVVALVPAILTVVAGPAFIRIFDQFEKMSR